MGYGCVSVCIGIQRRIMAATENIERKTQKSTPYSYQWANIAKWPILCAIATACYTLCITFITVHSQVHTISHTIWTRREREKWNSEQKGRKKKSNNSERQPTTNVSWRSFLFYFFFSIIYRISPHVWNFQSAKLSLSAFKMGNLIFNWFLFIWNGTVL